MPFPPPRHLLLILLASCLSFPCPSLSHALLTPSRRRLHQPFFPDQSSPPPLPPPAPPFFPAIPAPPPPRPSPTSPEQPTYPSLMLPNTTSASATPLGDGSHRSMSPSKLIPAILVPLLTLALLALAVWFFFSHRHRGNAGDGDAERKFVQPESRRLFAPNGFSCGGYAQQPASAEFLYVGTMASRGDGRRSDTSSSVDGNPGNSDGSPKLRPLPPLAQQCRQPGSGSPGGLSTSSGEEEFYSPRGSSVKTSSSRRTLAAAAVPMPELSESGSRGSNVSTPSYPSSPAMTSRAPTSPPGLSSPGQSGRRSIKSRSESARLVDLPPSPPPPPPPPLPPHYEPTPPSPSPRRKPPPPSPPSSPLNDASTAAKSTEHFPTSAFTQPPPPPPPPPPPVGYWESRVRKPGSAQESRSPALSPPPPRAANPKNLPAIEALPTEDTDKSEETTPRPKLKALHWDKVQASSERAMVWDQLKCSSFKVNEEMIETLFICNPANRNATSAAGKETTERRPAVLAPPKAENTVLDPKKSQNIAILLRALNVTKEEVCDALIEGNMDNMGTELLETLVKMAPTKEEQIKLKEFKAETSPIKLGPAENFLKAVLDVPFAFKRVDAMLYIANFDSEINYLKKSFETLEVACDELRSSRLFLKLLEAVLKTGNRMNVGTNRGDAQAFKLDTLLKLVDVKGTDGKTTLLHFVVQEIIRSEGSRLNQSAQRTQANPLQDELECKKLGLQVVAGLGNDFSNVKKAATMDADMLSSYLMKLAGGIGKVSEVLQLNEESGLKEDAQRFHVAMQRFLRKADDDIIMVQAQESVALSLVKEITEYFHGDLAKEEAHPFRIFMVVRDFLSVLDRVCREVGRINDHTIASTVRHFPVPVNPMLPQLFPKIHALRAGGSDDESSASS